MAFSESLNFGDSTFMNLESQVKRAIGGNECAAEKLPSEYVASSLDMIDESPKHNNKVALSRTRSRLLVPTNNDCSARNSERKKMPRSKSDSTLDVAAAFAGRNLSEHKNYSEFFHTEFTIEEELLRQEQELSFIRVSRIEEALEKDLPTEREKVDTSELIFNESVFPKDAQESLHSEIDIDEFSSKPILDEQIFSEDVEGLSNDEEATEEKNLQDIWKDSLPISEMSVEPLEQEPNEAPEEIPHIDETSFIGFCNGKENKLSVAIELEHSRRLVDHTFQSESFTMKCLKESNTRIDREKKKSPQTITNPPAMPPTCGNEMDHANPEDQKLLSAWGLPTRVLCEYDKKGIRKMFDWQIQCLGNSKVLFEHCNLVYSAPTSAGKTLVSEILVIKTILERDKKVIIILPFISVVREKMFYLQDLLSSSGYRVEGFFGGYTPPGGFESIHVAICTIEKANSIVNKLLEVGKLDEIGIVVVDEVHLISDPGRGYILELLLAKILYMSKKYDIHIQIVTMSATLANVKLLKDWLDAELFVTDFRPVALQEMIKIGNKIYDCNMKELRELSSNDEYSILQNDSDHVSRLCIETLLEGCSVVVFCPSKDWCEKLAVQLAGAIHTLGKSGSEFGQRLRTCINRDAIVAVKKQLKDIPTGLDAVLEKTITFGCAFHHAGLTTEERDIVEASFKSGALKIIVATSTLSSGVNLPARRVIIRSPLFGGKQMSSLTYRQMIGRAGRTGKDTLGESILICTESNSRVGRELISADLKPISSCLEMESSTHLKRALLEVISSGVASTKQDIKDFVNCTLLSTQKRFHDLTSIEDSETNKDGSDPDYIKVSLDFLVEYEFIRLQLSEETNEEKYLATRLGLACLASSMPPTDGLILFSELQKSRRCFVLESELHAVYLVTPYSVCYQLQELDWLLFLDLWEKLSPAMKKVGELVGIKESFLVRAMRGQSKLDYKLMQIHKRFYTALALQELVNETPINEVALKFKCNRGMLQSLQQMASTFAGIVTAFCNSLNWSTLSLIVSQFKERLFFGIHRDLIDLMRLPDLNHKRARALYDGGITNLVELAKADAFLVEKILYNALSFDSAKQHDHEDKFENNRRNTERNFFITGKVGITVDEAAKMLVHDARVFVQYEIGGGRINWSNTELERDEGRPSQVTTNHGDIKTLKRKSPEKTLVSPAKLPKVNENPTNEPSINSRNMTKSMELVQNKRTTQASVDSRTRSDLKKNVVTNGNFVENNQNHANTSRNALVHQKSIASKRSTETGHLIRNQQTAKSPQQNVKTTIKPSDKEIRRHSIKQCNAVFSSGVSSLNPTLEPTFKTPTRTTSSTTRVNEYEQSKENKKNGNDFSTNGPAIKTNNHVMTPSMKSGLTKKSPPTSKVPRRSPRNHLASSTRLEGKNNVTRNTVKSKETTDMELFIDDESFELNTGIENALELAEKQGSSPSNLDRSGDEIPSSQKFEEENEGTTAGVQTPHASRFLRSYRTQRCVSPKVEKAPPREISAESSHPGQSTSIELSDISTENSLIKNPHHLNASHILSCSKEDAAVASSFQSIQIIDICGNQSLFKSALKELMDAKRFGISLGFQKDENKHKPLIGANLLINQVPAKEQCVSVESKKMCFQIEEMSCYLVGVAFSISENIVYFMNMQDEGTCSGLTKQLKSKYLRMILRSPDNVLLVHDAKQQLKMLRKAMPELSDICAHLEDPKVANWLLQPDKNLSFGSMAQQFAPECTGLANLCGCSRSFSSLGLDANNTIIAKVRCSIEACVTVHILKGQIENLARIGSGQLLKFFNELEMPIQLSLCNMETYGFPTNESALRNLYQQMMETMKKLETKIYNLHGSRFNLGSTSAVARVLGLHRKSNGRISTSKQILEKIDSPMAQLIITYRKLSVTLTKNIQPLLKCVANDRIYGQSITFTTTGRISMTEPNLQNVAKDFTVDLDVADVCTISCRSAFFPTDQKRCLISSDFCQLEMRILAHLSQDKTLLQVMNSEKDVFTAIAARWNKIPEDEVSELLRNGTKQICYGIVYGMGMRSLADALQCTEQEASNVSEQFHAAYPGIRSYADKVIKFARHNGYIETITGRRRYLEYINSGEPQIKNQGERQAVNSTIQGSAADIAKSAIIRMEKNITKYREKLGINESSVRLVLHLHDELIFEVPEEKAKKIAKVLSVTMENCVKLNVPLKVKLKIGRTWGSLKEVKL